MHATSTPAGDLAEDRERKFEAFYDSDLLPQWENGNGPERIAMLSHLMPEDELAELVDAFFHETYKAIWRKRHGM